MADLGDLLGSLMSGLIRARQVADEQTAALAEYYRTNPLLEGLSVPRIRVPELTLEVPMLIEEHVEGQSGEMADPGKIAKEAAAQFKATITDRKLKLDPTVHKAFNDELTSQLTKLKDTGAPVMRETVARTIQDALAATMKQSNVDLDAAHKEAIAKDLRSAASTISFTKEPIAPSIHANIRTADVKEKASDKNVVRLTIHLKEEGLEWTTQVSPSGGVRNTLTPE